MKFINLKNWASEKSPTELHGRDVVAYVGILLVCFLLFQQGDLFHTTASSYAYLHGHFLDFYDYNKQVVHGNDYLPIIYVIFALWNLPLHIFGLTTDIAAQGFMGLSFIEIFWAKLLLVLFFFATAIMTYKTAKVISEGARDQARLATGLFITAPIAVFAVFIFGQYDIIGLFFTMTGFYYYVRKDLNRFAWFFSAAISFKFFPLVIFIPLILLAEKRLVYLAKFGLIAVTVSMLQVVLYWGSNAFRQEIFSIASEKTSHLAVFGLSPLNSAPYLLVVFAIVCLYAYIKEPQNDEEWRKVATLTPIAVYGTMFSTVIWHPQWLVIIMPFFALAALYIKDKTKSYVIDIIGMIAFIWVVVNVWSHGVDVSMLSGGMFKGYVANIPIVNADLMPARFVPVFETIFFIYLFSPLLVIAFQKSNRDLLYVAASHNRTFRARFILGVSVFVIPSLFCAFAPMSVVLRINPQAFVAYFKPGLALELPQKPVGEIFGDGAVIQSFKAEHDKLCVVSVMLATYARTNDATVKLALLADDGAIIATQTIDGKKLHDNAFHNFLFPAIAGSKGKTYQIKISSPDGKAGNAITAWMSESDIYPDGKLTVNNLTLPGDLMIKLYYER